MTIDTLIEQVMEAFTNPGKNPRQSALVAGVLFLLFLCLVTVFFLLLPQDDPDEAEESAGGRVPPNGSRGPSARSRLAYLGGSFIIVGVLLAGLGVGDGMSRKDGFCGRCHVMGPSISTWQSGSHDGVSCVQCHDSPGALGAVDTRLRAVADLRASLDGSTVVAARSVVNQARCRSCHENAMKEIIVVGSTRVRHEDFDRSIPCVQCHGRVGHQAGGAEGLISGSSIMATCADCHDGVGAPNDCTTCHLGDIAFAGGGLAEFAKIDLPEPDTCSGCHELDRCTACHGVEMPHPPDWKEAKRHAPSGAFDRDTCTLCHDVGCAPCHRGIHTSHGPDWQEDHKKAANGTNCLRCHDTKDVGPDMCRLCHT